MSRLEDCRSVDEIDKCFSRKISLIDECIELRSADHKTASFFRDIEIAVVDVRKIFQEIKGELNEGRSQLRELEEMIRAFEFFEERVEDMLDNLDYLEPESPPKRERVVISPIPSTFKPVKVPEKISCLTKTEFERVPKYMKGRIQYSQVNDFIGTFNKVITMKYKLLSVPHKSLKPADYKIVNTMKSQETAETKGKYFCTGENLKEYGKIKMDKTTNAFMQILRHCNRIKEVRGPGPLVRYVIKV